MNFLKNEQLVSVITDPEIFKATQVRLRLKIYIFSFTMTHKNWRVLSWLLRILLSCLQYLPNISVVEYFLEVEVPCKSPDDDSYSRRGGRSDIPFILKSIKLIKKFFRKCYEAKVSPELLTQDEAEAYEGIKRELNFLVKNLFKQVKFISALNTELPELLPVAIQIQETNIELSNVNDKLFLQTSPTLPGYVFKRLGDCIPPLPDSPIIWVEDPVTNFLMPFVARQHELDLVRDLLSGRTQPRDLPAGITQIFSLAKILCEQQQTIKDRQVFEFTKLAAESLQRDSYVVLRGVLNPLQIAAYRSYYRSMESAGLLRVDSSAQHRLFKHNEPLAKFVHIQLEALLNKILKERVKKSYCYVRAHKAGAVLKKHIDRPQCEWNISLILDMGPDRAHEVPWPIFLEIDGETKEVLLQMGDAVLYQGTKVPHWRNELPAGHETTAVFFTL